MRLHEIFLEGAAPAQREHRLQYHLSVEPNLKPMTPFTRQTRTQSSAGARGEAGGEGIYTTSNPRYWASQLAYEGVGEFPHYLYLVWVKGGGEGTMWAAHQDASPPEDVTVLTLLGDLGDGDDMPDIGRYEWIGEKWVAAHQAEIKQLSGPADKPIGESTEAPPPKPKPSDVLDAIEHADHEGMGWTRKDFTFRYEGYLSVDEIEGFENASGWLEVDEPVDLQTYRGGSFKGEAREMPPIIIVTSPEEESCNTQVGDGRGRVNFANAHGLRLHVWHMIHREC